MANGTILIDPVLPITNTLSRIPLFTYLASLGALPQKILPSESEKKVPSNYRKKLPSEHQKKLPSELEKKVLDICNQQAKYLPIYLPSK